MDDPTNLMVVTGVMVLDTPVPFAPELEDAYIPSVDSTVAALDRLLAY